METLNFIWMLFLTFLALAIVCGLAYFVFRIILPKLNVSLSSKSMIRIVDRIGLDSRKSLYIIEVADEYMLISVSENGVQMVSKLDNVSAKSAEEQISKPRAKQTHNNNFAEKISQLLNKKSGDK
jgi:flagellar protein FliO/FliZ